MNYEQITKDFKPIFGNLNHIEITKSCKKIDSIQKEIDQKKALLKQANKQTEEVERLKKHVMFLYNE